MADTSAFCLGFSLYAYLVRVCVFVSNEKWTPTTSTTTPENVDLRDQIISVQEEKKTLAIELENLRSNFAEVSIMAGWVWSGYLVSSLGLI